MRAGVPIDAAVHEELIDTDQQNKNSSSPHARKWIVDQSAVWVTGRLRREVVAKCLLCVHRDVTQERPKNTPAAAATKT